MPSAELPFEALSAALETTRGTAIAAPTHYFPLKGILTPNKTLYSPEESRGTLVRNYRKKRTRAGAEWNAEGGVDPNYMPFLLNTVCKAVSAPTTPTDGVLTRLWSFVPTITSDDLKSLTVWWGDPNVQIFRSAFCMAESLTVDSDAGSEDGVTMGINGMGLFPSRVAAPSMPAQAVGDLLVPGAMQMWLDSSSAIGTTEITGRFLSTSWEIPTGTKPKYYAQGPGAAFTGGYTRTGRETREASADITVELNDQSIAASKEYQLWEADTTVKLRIRLNGDLIESVGAGPTLYYSYLELDIYGKGEDFSWEEVEGVNRAMKIGLKSLYDSTLGADFAVRVQNAKATL